MQHCRLKTEVNSAIFRYTLGELRGASWSGTLCGVLGQDTVLSNRLPLPIVGIPMSTGAFNAGDTPAID